MGSVSKVLPWFLFFCLSGSMVHADEKTCFVKLSSTEAPDFVNIKHLSENNENTYSDLDALTDCIIAAYQQNIKDCVVKNGDVITLKVPKISCQMNDYILVGFENTDVPDPLSVRLLNYNESTVGKGKKAVVHSSWRGAKLVGKPGASISNKLIKFD